MPQDSILVDKHEAASLLGVSVRTIEHLIKNKQLGVIRIGRRVVIQRQSLVDFAKRDHHTQTGRGR